MNLPNVASPGFIFGLVVAGPPMSRSAAVLSTGKNPADRGPRSSAGLAAPLGAT